VGELIFIIVFIFAFSVILLIGHNVSTDMELRLNETGINTSVVDVPDSLTRFDMGVFLIFVGLCLAAIISAFFVQSHPIYFFFSIVGLIVVFTMAIIFSYMYNEIGTTPMLQASANAFPYISLIFNNLLLISVGMGFLIVIALYGKPQGTLYG